MSVTIRTLRISKHGVSPLVILSEHSDALKQWIEAYIAWPESPINGGANIVRIVRLGLKLDPNEDSIERGDAIDTMRLTADEEVLQYAATLAAGSQTPVEEITLDTVNLKRLRAWRSFGLFPGLINGDGLNQPSLHFINQLDQPIGFLR